MPINHKHISFIVPFCISSLNIICSWLHNFSGIYNSRTLEELSSHVLTLPIFLLTCSLVSCLSFCLRHYYYYYFCFCCAKSHSPFRFKFKITSPGAPLFAKANFTRKFQTHVMTRVLKMCFLLQILGERDSTISLSASPCILRACKRNQCGRLIYNKYKLLLKTYILNTALLSVNSKTENKILTGSFIHSSNNC